MEVYLFLILSSPFQMAGVEGKGERGKHRERKMGKDERRREEKE
jgi:hypothetical protein